MAQETQRTERLREHIAQLASEIGERNLYRYENLQATARFIEHGWHELGYSVSRQVYEAKELQFANLEIEIRGTSKPEEIVIVGAHYDTHRNHRLRAFGLGKAHRPGVWMLASIAKNCLTN